MSSLMMLSTALAMIHLTDIDGVNTRVLVEGNQMAGCDTFENDKQVQRHFATAARDLHTSLEADLSEVHSLLQTYVSFLRALLHHESEV